MWIAHLRDHKSHLNESFVVSQMRLYCNSKVGPMCCNMSRNYAYYAYYTAYMTTDYACTLYTINS